MKKVKKGCRLSFFSEKYKENGRKKTMGLRREWEKGIMR